MSGITREEVKEWFELGKAKNQYMFVCMDTYDYGCFPIYCKDFESAIRKKKELAVTPMVRIMECYKLSLDFDEQYNTSRVWNLK